jgi:hypothetical protein
MTLAHKGFFCARVARCKMCRRRTKTNTRPAASTKRILPWAEPTSMTPIVNTKKASTPIQMVSIVGHT